MTELAEFDVLTAINRSQTGLSRMVTRFLHFSSRIIFFNAKNACCFGVHFGNANLDPKRCQVRGFDEFNEFKVRCFVFLCFLL